LFEGSVKVVSVL